MALIVMFVNKNRMEFQVAVKAGKETVGVNVDSEPDWNQPRDVSIPNLEGDKFLSLVRDGFLPDYQGKRAIFGEIASWLHSAIPESEKYKKVRALGDIEGLADRAPGNCASLFFLMLTGCVMRWKTPPAMERGRGPRSRLAPRSISLPAVRPAFTSGFLGLYRRSCLYPPGLGVGASHRPPDDYDRIQPAWASLYVLVPAPQSSRRPPIFFCFYA